MGTGSNGLKKGGGDVDTSYAYTQNWDKAQGVQAVGRAFLRGQSDMVLVSKNGHYAMADSWGDAQSAFENGWEYEDTNRRMLMGSVPGDEVKRAFFDGVNRFNVEKVERSLRVAEIGTTIGFGNQGGTAEKEGFDRWSLNLPDGRIILTDAGVADVLEKAWQTLDTKKAKFT